MLCPRTDGRRLRWLLRTRRERPRGRRAAEQRDELAAPHHSITSSARASSVGGTVEAERLGGPEVDHQFELRGAVDRQVRGLGTLEDAAGIDADPSICIGYAVAVADQAAGRDEITQL